MPENKWLSDPSWSDEVSDYVSHAHSIRLVFNKPKNNGFYASTIVEYSERNNEELSDPKQ